MRSWMLGPGVLGAALLATQACGETVGGRCTTQAECPGQSICSSFDVGDERACHAVCETPDDCAEGELCSPPDLAGDRVCHAPFPNCDPEATDATCECGTLSGALRVQGDGDACAVLDRDVTVCAWHRYECLDGGCTVGYARYSYPDDAGYIMRRSGPSHMSEGWEPDGSISEGTEGTGPTSCPAAEAEF
jgi:hypothetical protein